jgi:hypothetical protein
VHRDRFGSIAAVSGPNPPGDDSTQNEIDAEGAAEARANAAAALRDAFTRLSPQGSDEWNFQAAFTHLGDRYGPYHPGASGLSDLLGPRPENDPRGTGGLRGRLGGRGGRAPRPDGEKSELEEAMAQVVEAFRFLSARVSTLEARVAAQDHPVDGAAWLTPARDLDDWTGPIAAHVLAQTPGGDVIHADCGEGTLLRALTRAGAPARGVEPRGGVALRALEGGCSVTICEVDEALAACQASALGGLVLSGVVDRVPLHALVALLGECRRTLALGAPLVVVSEPPRASERWGPAAEELQQGRPLHSATWELLLDRAGFAEVAPLPPGPGGGGDGRFVLTASAPA